ncbi:MAG: hypothetical protein L6Q37_13490, partial [Bdellovibrionaceae bacterium]|nr:hypothetical protein [Pseudobdellovibrionaceae bacterium]
KVPDYNQTALYKALHFLHTKGLICFSKEIHFVNENENLDFINGVLAQIKTMTAFEILQTYGLAKFNNKESAKAEIVNIIGPRPTSENPKLIKVWEDARLIIEKAIQTLSTEAKQKMEKEAEEDEAANKVKATQLVDEARKELLMNLYQPALEKLKEAAKLNTNIFQFNIYLAWAKLGTALPKKNKETLKEVEMDLMQISPDERYDALYPYVMGLYFKAKNDLLNSKKSFDKALAMDTTFISARRELSLVEMMMKKNKKNDSIFTMDLKDMVTVLFKKK